MPSTEIHASAQPSRHDLDEPFVVDNYELFRLLGEGGIGTTYLGRDLRSGDLVAVKGLQLLRSKHRHHIELFEREADTLRSLDHPQIPELFGTLVSDGTETFTLYLVQEFIEGRSLGQLLDEGHTFDEPEVVSLMLSCLDPLEYLHLQDPPLYHRDIKPSNIILRGDGTCALIDFGAVRQALADPKDAASSVVGTFGYMAPEQFHARVNAATDLYSLGATALHLLTGRAPKDFRIKRLKPDFHNTVVMDPHLAAILDLLLEPVDEDRYQSAASLRRALERWRAERARATETPPAPDQVDPAEAESVTRSPIILLSGEQEAVAFDSPEEPEEDLASGDDAAAAAGDPVPEEGVGSEAMLLPAIPVENDEDDENDEAFEREMRRARAKRRRPRRSRKPGKARPGQAGLRGTDVPIRRLRDPWWSLLYPPAPGYTHVGAVFLALAFLVLVLWNVVEMSELGVAPPIVAGALIAFGLSYFVLAWLRRRRFRSVGLLGTTDGRLVRIDVRTTMLGEKHVTVHYEFHVSDRRYLGERTFTSRRQAQPYLRKSLPQMVFFDEEDPNRSTLDRLE